MLRPRIIPCLLVHKGGLVKTQKFTDPKYVGDPVAGYQTFKVLADGSLVVADPLLTHVHGIEDITPAEAENKALGKVRSALEPTEAQKLDLLVAWYMNISATQLRA